MPVPTFVQVSNDANQQGASTNPTCRAFLSPCTTGNAIIYFCGQRTNTDRSASTATDGTNTYTKLGAFSAQDANNNMIVAVYLALNITGGSGFAPNTTLSLATAVNSFACEYSGVALVNALDSITSANRTGSATTTTSLTAAAAGEVLIVLGTYQGGGTTWSSSTATLRSNNLSNDIMAIGDQTTTLGSNTFSMTTSNSSSSPGIVGLTLKPPVGLIQRTLVGVGI